MGVGVEGGGGSIVSIALMVGVGGGRSMRS